MLWTLAIIIFAVYVIIQALKLKGNSVDSFFKLTPNGQIDYLITTVIDKEEALDGKDKRELMIQLAELLERKKSEEEIANEMKISIDSVEKLILAGLYTQTPDPKKWNI